MTIIILFQSSGFRNFKTYYTGHVCAHLRKEFPGLVSYQRIVELQSQTALPLTAFLLALNEVAPKLRQAIAEMKEHHEINYDPVDDDEFDGYTDEDAINDLMDECGQNRDGYCSLAGSKYCEFECPFRDEVE